MNQYFIVFVVICVVCIIQEMRKPGTRIPLWVMILFAVLIGIRAEGVDQDYTSYITAISNISGFTKEPTFSLIVKIANTYFGKYNVVGVFCIYSFLSIFLSFSAFNKYSISPLISLIVFFSTYMVLEEFNAIRAGVASGFIVLSIDSWGKKDWKTFIYFLCAILFHYSYLIILPVYFLVSNDEKKRIIFLLLVPLAYLFYYTIDFSSIIPFVNSLLGTERMDIDYQASLLNVFSTIIIFRIAFCYYLWIKRDVFSAISPYYYIFLKLYTIGIFIAIALASMPMINMRLMYIFLCFELFLFPVFIKGHRNKVIPMTITISYCIFSLYIYIIQGEYLLEYSINTVFQ